MRAGKKFPYDNHPIYYESCGAGKPLLLHGNTASSRRLDPIIPMPAEKHRVITMDCLGCGRSDRLAARPADLWYEWARQVHALCAHLALSKVYLVGTSGGALAAEYPQLVRAAALGITPILIAADPASDVETPYLKIRALRELLQEWI
ncbi:MAG: alpha/beta fold hydrolase [Clostridia bacterium]|nr:alpha/beta fold hydrolase [Clostridia bacterium]MBR6186103.1 alpha/beta fold hydrolase [Clostridia bacterium]